MKYQTSINRIVELTPERKAHILAEHPDLKEHFQNIKLVLSDPEEIRISKTDSAVLLFYKLNR